MTLGVSDVERARSFYEALGWSGRTSPTGQMWLCQLNGMIFGLLDREALAADCVVEDNGGWGGIQLTQLVSSPAEVDAILVDAEAAGGTVGRRGEQRFWGYTGLFFDPDGHAWEIITNPGWILDDDGSTRLP